MRVNAESRPALSRFRPEKRPIITDEVARLFCEGDRLLDVRIGASDLITRGTSNHSVVLRRTVQRTSGYIRGGGLAPC
jgi:hypothetical protein